MPSSQRKQTILARLAREKQVKSRDLSQLFGLSEASVRRNLRERAAGGLLQRVHGAALGILETRKSVHTAPKRIISQKAVTLSRALHRQKVTIL